MLTSTFNHRMKDVAPMRIGIAGTGTMAEVHAAAWHTMGAELTGCTSLSPTQAEAFSQRHNIRRFGNYADLLDTVDIVDICTPTATHKPMVLGAAEAGKHVICEKPIALSVEDAQAMIDACRDVRFFVGMV